MSRPSITAMMAGALAPIATGPALAHPGPHHGMSFAELAQHLASGWHLIMLAVAATAIGVAVLVLGQRRQARARRGAPSRR